MKIENNVIGKQHQVLMQTYKTEQVILRKKQTESKDRRWGWTAQGVHWAAYSRATLKCTKSFELSSKGVLFEKKKYNGSESMRQQEEGCSLLEVSHNVIGDEYSLLILLALMECQFLFLYSTSFVVVVIPLQLFVCTAPTNQQEWFIW